MIYKILFTIIFYSILLPYEVKINNSLFNLSKSARVSALGNCTFLSNKIGDIFTNPNDVLLSIAKKPHFSYFKYFQNSIKIFQFNYNLLENDKQKINFGIIRRVLENIYNTKNAWVDQNQNNSPEYFEINYDAIYKYSDQEIGLLFSYNRKIKNNILNIKFKPSMHIVDEHKAHGFDIDIYFNKNFKKLNILLGLVDSSYKNWDNGTYEKRNFNSLFGFSTRFNNLFLIFNYFEKNYKAGVEYMFHKNFHFRLGISEINKMSFGFGLNLKSIDINYAYFKLININEPINQISFTMNLKEINNIFN